jgi:hypothetical protein
METAGRRAGGIANVVRYATFIQELAKGGKSMRTAVMMKRIAEASPRFKARIAGVLSLLSLLAAVFGEFIVRRFEIGADLVAVSGNIVVTLLLYDIFKPVNRRLSLLAASFNLVGLICGLFDGILGAWTSPWYLTVSIASWSATSFSGRPFCHEFWAR